MGEPGGLPPASALPVLRFPEQPLRAEQPTQFISLCPLARSEQYWIHFTDEENEAQRGPTHKPSVPSLVTDEWQRQDSSLI